LIWTTPRNDPEDKPRGEIGYLPQVSMSKNFSDVIILVIEYEGTKYVGSLRYEAPTAYYKTYDILTSKIGLSIREIGNIDL
jgi:hypothetical protein